ncbi:AAA family ATPase [Polyangium sorediatum]|uniref:ATP-binding protein n=1 Tax=Polyangium sorediatum TaxID=889274 RepID=A0ABT6P1L6_9BACT|nr:ATP-binding protein [Polyangium sorediatum]MDI1434502.1 ATP-binding protein [Polyangium sorediatum]
MITRFEVDGFKSLRDFAVDLEPLTVFVGPNGAGKSNLLEAMALLGRLASMPVEEAFKKGRGRVLDQFSRFGGETSRTIRFTVEVSLGTPIPAFEDGAPSLPTRYRYELTIERRARDSGIEELAIKDESLRVKADGDDAAEGALVLWQARQVGPHRLLSVLPNTGEGAEQWFHFPFFTTLFPHYNRAQSRGWHAVIGAIARGFDSFRFLHLDAARLREPSEKISSGILAPDASNLAAILADLPAPALGAIRADLASLVPGLSGFDVVPEGDALRLDFKLSGGEHLPARLASDGTLRALALLTVLTVEPHPSVLGIEEPENGIYPGRLRRLLSILRDTSASDNKSQILLTTHSPVVVAAFRDQPQMLRVVDVVVRDGKRETRARPVGKPKKPSDSAFVASLREVDMLLHAADAEAAE